MNTAQTLEAVAQKHLNHTLETRNSDELDFPILSVWSLKAALEAAYVAGVAAGAVAALEGYTGRK